MIRFEYFANAAARVERCRAAMATYFIQDLRAATDPAKQLPPEYQLAVENMEELRRESLIQPLRQRIRDVRQGPDGLLYLLTDEDNGAVLRIEPAS